MPSQALLTAGLYEPRVAMKEVSQAHVAADDDVICENERPNVVLAAKNAICTSAELRIRELSNEMNCNHLHA